MTNNVIQGTEGVLRGIKIITDSLRPTYGNYGTNKIIECDETPFHKVTNDAKTITDSIFSNNREERIGINLFKELMNEQDKLSGDGRKTTAIIADTLIELGSKLDMPRVQLKRELDALIPIVEARIDEQTRQITENDVEAVATIASESPEIGKLLGTIYKETGKDVLIDPQPSGTRETYYKVTEGVRFKDTGYLSEQMAIKGQAVYEKPAIMVTKRKMTNVNEVNPILEMMQSNGMNELVIFTDDMDSSVATSLVNVHKSGMMKILIIKAPVLWKQYVFEDFAKCVGATIVEDSTGVKYSNFSLSHLGTCGKIIVDSQETILKGIKDIDEHIAKLKSDNTDDSRLRLSWLKTKSVDLFLGANGESDLYYKTMKCRDAINASKLALEGGVVEGGGVCLLSVANNFECNSQVDDVVCKALKSPLEQLMTNCGENIDSYKVNEDVLDASLVLKNAVRSAIGLASTALTVDSPIPFLEKTQEELALLSATKPAF